jgi:threonine synthase
MNWISSRGASPPVNFVDALFAGTAPDGGLYMPERIDPLPAEALRRVRGADIGTIATVVGAHLLRGEITEAALEPLVRDALDFPVPLVPVTDRFWALELFHGPTLAFKDVGARVQARLLHHFTDGTPLTILVATSGDTGSAVAQAFHRVPDTRVVVLYPAGKVSDVQEAQMASMGDNILAIAVDGTFDDCQRLVKTAFADDELRTHVWLTPANSINLGRLLPQVFYYFLVSALSGSGGEPGDSPGDEHCPVVAVPSGNFGDLTAGLIA